MNTGRSGVVDSIRVVPRNNEKHRVEAIIAVFKRNSRMEKD